MYINEFVENDIVTVRLIRKDGKHFDLETTVVLLNDKQTEQLKKTFGDNFVVTKPMYQLSKINISQLDINIIGRKNNTPYTWNENVSLKAIKIKDVVYHVIICSQNASNKNLRRSYRQQISVCGTIHFNNNQDTDFVMIRDISLNGIGLSASKDTNVKENDEIMLHFNDEECNASFTLKLIVVRIKPLNDNKVIIGCKFTENQDHALAKYITEKQRFGLKRNKNKQ